VDWYRRGWVAVVLDPDAQAAVLTGSDLEQLIARFPHARCVAVDMPIGLPVTVRACDQLAKAFIGPRHNSVFMTPPEAVLYASTYDEANRIAQRVLDGKKISKQSYALAQNVKIVNEVAKRDPRVIEVHPEVSFRALAGAHVAWPKTTWNGQALRRECLGRAGISPPDLLEDGGGVPVEDVLDACVAAWSARRYANGEALSLPEGADPAEREIIWY
jgi:predicted RNase H-like nuclease